VGAKGGANIWKVRGWNCKEEKNKKKTRQGGRDSINSSSGANRQEQFSSKEPATKTIKGGEVGLDTAERASEVTREKLKKGKVSGNTFRSKRVEKELSSQRGKKIRKDGKVTTADSWPQHQRGEKGGGRRVG